MKCQKGYKKVGDKCERKSYSKSNGPVNINAMWMFITIFGIFIIAGAVFYGGSQGWFRSLSVVNNEEIVSYLDGEVGIQDSCSLSLNPSFIYVGESVTGSLNDGINSFCQVFASEGVEWTKVYEGYTDNNGYLEATRQINTAGNYVFRAICDLNNNNRIDVDDCLSNPADLVVSPLADETCTETDGGNNIYIPGITSFLGVSYMDSCLPEGQAVQEFYCNDGVKENNVACALGEVCVQTRSGAYCEASLPPLSDGDLISSTSGSGTSSETSNSFEIDLGDLESGNCGLQATISTSWDYESGSCEGLQGMEGVQWDFFDSIKLKYSRVDTNPIGLGVVTDCDLVYDGTPFKLMMSKLMGLPDCELSYEWEVRILACNCVD